MVLTIAIGKSEVKGSQVLKIGLCPIATSPPLFSKHTKLSNAFWYVHSMDVWPMAYEIGRARNIFFFFHDDNLFSQCILTTTTWFQADGILVHM